MSYDDPRELEPPNSLYGVQAKYHYDDYGKEWVVRLHTPNGSYTSVCGCPSELEAQGVCAAFAFYLAMADVVFSEEVGNTIRDGMTVRNIFIEGESVDRYFAARDLGVEAGAVLHDLVS
jgi:hypothetical protein